MNKRKKGIYRNCKVCGIQFYVYPSRIKNHFYCSEKCKYKNGTHPNKGNFKKSGFKKCLECDKEFRYYFNSNKKFCSDKCYYTYYRKNKRIIDIEKRNKTREKTNVATLELIDEIKSRKNRFINFDKKPRPDIIEIDFENKQIIAYEIETAKNKYEDRKISVFQKQFLDLGLIYDKVIVRSVDKNKIVWRKFFPK